jgi:hypothetical protein
MRAPISIIIPTLNAAGDLPATLASLTEGLQAGLIRELILSDGGSGDNTAALADRAGARLLTGATGRGGQLARGAAAAQGDWLLFLHADTQLAPGWTQAVLDHLRDHPDKAGYFRLRFRTQGAAPRLVAGWANLRARMFGLPYGDQGLLIRQDVYTSAGGYPPIPLMEDVAFARALKGRLIQMTGTARTSAAKYESQGWLKRGSRNLITLIRFLGGASPEDLAKSYHAK